MVGLYANFLGYPWELGWGLSLVAAMMSSSISFLSFAKPSFSPREEEEEEEEVSADKMPPSLPTYMPKKSLAS